MAAKFVFREDLEELMSGGCACCAELGKESKHTHDQPLYIHGSCHQDAPPWTYYKNGLLHIECSVCRKPIVTVQVASKG